MVHIRANVIDGRHVCRDSMKALCERARKLQNVLQHVDASKESALEKAIQDLTG